MQAPPIYRVTTVQCAENSWYTCTSNNILFLNGNSIEITGDLLCSLIQKSYGSFNFTFCFQKGDQNSPLIYVPCGHNTCISCSKGRELCPCCGSQASSKTRNIMLMQIIEVSKNKTMIDRDCQMSNVRSQCFAYSLVQKMLSFLSNLVVIISLPQSMLF